MYIIDLNMTSTIVINKSVRVTGGIAWLQRVW